MKTLTSTTTTATPTTYANDDPPLAAVKCAELYRIGATGEYRFRCCLCATGEFGSTGDILAHVQHEHPADGSMLGAGVLADPLSPSSSPSSGVCLTTLSSSSLRLGQKRCGSSDDDEDGLDAEDQDAQSGDAVIRHGSGGGGYSVETPTTIDNNGRTEPDDPDDTIDHDDDLLDDLLDDPDDHDDDTISTIADATIGAPHPAYSCLKCGQTFSFNYALKMHQCTANRAAAATAEFTCDVCGLRTADARTLAEHTDTHATGEPCVCPVCGAAFDTRHDLKQHDRSAHRQPASSDSAAVTAGADEKPHKCQVCGRRYAKRTALDEHMRVHTGEKPFRCFVCGKAFARRVLVRQHERIHTGETPYKCRHCAMTFTYGASRRAHEKNKHPDV